MKNNNIRPNQLKGNDQVNRMRSLMGMTPITESNKRSVVELTKKGPDGKVYGIVRENHKYFIKVAEASNNLVTEDFNYIGGLKNKTDKSYHSYADATKQLNLKFISLNEALGKSDSINVLKNDNLLGESFESYSEKPKSSQPDKPLGTVKEMGKNDGHEEEVIGDEGETGNPDVSTPKTEKDAEVVPNGEDGDPYTEDGDASELTESDKADKDYDGDGEVESGEEEYKGSKDKAIKKAMDEEVELTEAERAIDNIIRELREGTEDKLRIGTAIGNIKKGEVSSKKKV